MGYLIDSNVLIDYANNRCTNNQLKALDLILDEALTISIITKIEILGHANEPDEETQILMLLNYAEIIALNDEVVDKTISLKKSVKIKTPDAIIACTALVNNLTLITNNIADFKKLKGLKTFNPYAL